jgi:hypothetical protein
MRLIIGESEGTGVSPTAAGNAAIAAIAGNALAPAANAIDAIHPRALRFMQGF